MERGTIRREVELMAAAPSSAGSTAGGGPAPPEPPWATLKTKDTACSYSKRLLCPMQWTLDVPLAKCMSAAMECGGPIALLHGDGTTPGARLQIFNGAGELLSAWEWDYGRVRALGWNPSVQLVCVLESGRVMLWTLQGARAADFALGEACENQGVLQCEVFSTGFVVLTAAYRLFVLTSYAHRTVVPLADPRLSSPPTAMAVLEASQAESGARCPDVLLATASRTILLIDEAEAHDQLLASGP